MKFSCTHLRIFSFLIPQNIFALFSFSFLFFFFLLLQPASLSACTTILTSSSFFFSFTLFIKRITSASALLQNPPLLALIHPHILASLSSFQLLWPPFSFFNPLSIKGHHHNTPFLFSLQALSSPNHLQCCLQISLHNLGFSSLRSYIFSLHLFLSMNHFNPKPLFALNQFPLFLYGFPCLSRLYSYQS